MKSFEYYQLRAGGLGIIVGLSAVWGAIVGIAFAAAQREWSFVVAFAVWAAVIAFISGTPVGRWIGREVQSTVAVFSLLFFAVIPYYVFVWPPRKFAMSRGWIFEIERQ